MKKKSKKGFASMTPERLKEVGSKGGKVRVSKGFAVLSLEKRREIARMGVMKRVEQSVCYTNA